MRAAWLGLALIALGSRASADVCFEPQLDIQRAPSPWQVLAPLPHVPLLPVAMVHRGRLVVAGPFAGSGGAGVWIAAPGSGGALGAWVEQSRIPAQVAVMGFALAGDADHLYAIGGHTGEGHWTGNVAVAAVRADGTLGPWVDTTPLPGA